MGDLRNFNEIFRKDVAYGYIKSHKKAGFHHLPRKLILEKSRGRGGVGGGRIKQFMTQQKSFAIKIDKLRDASAV